MTSDPVLFAYAVQRSGNTKRPIWKGIGRAYAHETGHGLTVLLDCAPSDGVVILLERDEIDDRHLEAEASRARTALRRSGSLAPRANRGPGGHDTPALSFAEARTARRILQEHDVYSLSALELRALRAVLQDHDSNIALNNAELTIVRRLLRSRRLR